MDLSYALLGKYYICHLLQLQHSSYYLVAFSYDTYSKFNFLVNIVFSLHHLFDLLSSLYPIIVLNCACCWLRPALSRLVFLLQTLSPSTTTNNRLVSISCPVTPSSMIRWPPQAAHASTAHASTVYSISIIAIICSLCHHLGRWALVGLSVLAFVGTKLSFVSPLTSKSKPPNQITWSIWEWELWIPLQH